MDRRPPGTSVRGILQARILEWVAFSFANSFQYISPPLVRDSLLVNFLSSSSHTFPDLSFGGFLHNWGESNPPNEFIYSVVLIP